MALSANYLETLLSGYDAAATRGFRDEQRIWRADDLAFRELVVAHAAEKTDQRWALQGGAGAGGALAVERSHGGNVPSCQALSAPLHPYIPTHPPRCPSGPLRPVSSFANGGPTASNSSC